MFYLKAKNDNAGLSLAPIRTIFILASMALASSGYAAENSGPPIELPALGNTPDGDKALSLEVSDQFIWQRAIFSEKKGAQKNETAWDTILAAPRMPYHLHPNVAPFIATFKKDAWWIEKILKRSRPYLHYIVSNLEARGLPLDLSMIPVIESSYLPNVTSAGAAAGLWQIVPVTARQMELERTLWIDARADLRESTRAALDYLSYLNNKFDGDWELTLAAYNAGPGRVSAAISKNRKNGKPTDYWSLDLPRETKNYVPKLIAMIELLRQTPVSPFRLPEIANTQAFTEVEVGQRISLGIAAKLAGIKENSLKKLNAGLIHNVTPPKGPHTLLLPSHAASRFQKALTTHNASADAGGLYVLPITHLVQPGDNISSIALEYGISQSQLRDLNALESNVIRIGQQLAVVDARATRRKTGRAVAAQKAKKSTQKANNDAIDYIIQKGDTLSGIALRFKVRVNRITLADGSNPSELRLIPGQKLLIPVSQREKSS